MSVYVFENITDGNIQFAVRRHAKHQRADFCPEIYYYDAIDQNLDLRKMIRRRLRSAKAAGAKSIYLVLNGVEHYTGQQLQETAAAVRQYVGKPKKDADGVRISVAVIIQARGEHLHAISKLFSFGEKIPELMLTRLMRITRKDEVSRAMRYTLR